MCRSRGRGVGAALRRRCSIHAEAAGLGVEYGRFVAILSKARLRRDLTVKIYDDPDHLAAIGWDEVVAAEGAPIFYESAYLTAYHRFPIAPIERFGHLVINERSADLPRAVLPLALHSPSE